MKRILSIIITLLLLFNMNGIVAFGAEIYVVSANEVTITKDTTQLIPVKLKNNNGIMGFKISVEYNPEKTVVQSVARGTITAKGNFTTNFGTLGTKFDIVWNNTEEILGDGTLFILSVSCKETDKIKLSYSQPDTFNEKYEDVVLNCKNISVKYTDKQVSTTTETQETTTIDSESDKTFVIDNSQILQAIQISLKDYGYTSLKDVKNKKEFVDSVNKNLAIITGTNEYTIKDMNSLKQIYVSAFQGEFIKEVSNNIDSSKIETAIKNALNEIGVDSIDDIPEAEKIRFVNLVENILKDNNSDIPNISQEMSVEDAIETIKELDFDSTFTNSEYESKNNSEKKNIKPYVFALTGAIIVSCLVIIVVNRKKAKKNNK